MTKWSNFYVIIHIKDFFGGLKVFMIKALDKISLSNIESKNRIVRSATHCYLGNTDGTMSEAEYAMYEELAKNEVGIIITGHCSVAVSGMANEDQTAIYDDEFIPQLTKLHRLVAGYGAKIIVQINHAGPRAVHHDDLAGVCAAELKKGKHARALTLAEIAEIREQFIAAAYRVKQSGMDGVQIHAAHSYLLSQFIDKTFNHREDAYGGASIENRARLTMEIVAGIKEKCGADFPVFIKLNNDSKTDNEEYEQDLIYMLKEFKALGVEAVELSGVDFISKPRTETVYYLERIARVRKLVDIPLILVGGVRSLDEIETVLAAGVDMVSLARPFICEPNIIPLLLAGQEKAKCLSCNKCFALPKIKKGIRCVFKRK